MANLTTVLEAQKSLETALLQRMTDFENQLKDANPSSPGSINLCQLQADFVAFQKLVASILNILRQQIAECCKSIDVIEMRHRRKYLLFGGISEDIQQELPLHIAKLFADKLGLSDITPDEIKVCHRLGRKLDGKCRPVLIRFSDISLKSLVWRKKTGFKGTQYVVSEFLTPQRQSLFMQARARLGRNNCWTLDGNIFAKMHDGTKRRIASGEDLQDMPDPVSTDSANLAKGSQDPTPAAPSASTEGNPRAKRAARYKK